DGAATGERRSDLPGGKTSWIVPGDDRADDADWFAQCVIQKRAIDGNGLSIDPAYPVRIVAKRIDARIDIAANRFPERLAVFERFQGRQSFPVVLHQLGDAEQNAFLFGRIFAAPACIFKA